MGFWVATHIAATWGKDTVATLLLAGADPAAKSDGGCTALDVVVLVAREDGERASAIDEALENGLDPSTSSLSHESLCLWRAGQHPLQLLRDEVIEALSDKFDEYQLAVCVGDFVHLTPDRIAFYRRAAR